MMISERKLQAIMITTSLCMIAERKLAVYVPQGNELNRMNILPQIKNSTSERGKLNLKRELLKTFRKEETRSLRETTWIWTMLLVMELLAGRSEPGSPRITMRMPPIPWMPTGVKMRTMMRAWVKGPKGRAPDR